ncbi:MerR family transcriptional regulator [Phytoactinopolyspora alkaliphila]|uniref:MerR family transcriptional regulator n=1 Tax=Phytoactinopolyspora alkaliphila TaxID=1783498 RepID=A0A6N9YI73_9ACTN|nr:HEAT repeat domain-containing protein [Phytoactinopolyspora alkaliphila]NED94620.1 MerR family transcriptional regulator [Phytoactinopolyspora alkaliphila]
MLIGEVSERSGISTRMLRHYDRLGLVSPSVRTPSQYREYSEQDVRRLFHVEGLRSLGLSLQEIADVLADLSFSPASMVDQLITRTRDRLAREEELLGRLDQVQASQPSAWSDVLHIIGLMRGLDANDPSARQRFALSLAGEGNHDAVPLAEAALNETDPNVAGALYWALARIGNRALPVLAEALNSPIAGRRHRALAALEKISSPEASAALAEAFRHPDPLVRRRAVLARGTRGQADVIPALVTLVVEGRDDVEAADVLGLLACHHGCADQITTTIADELAGATGRARQRLTSALAEIPGAQAQTTLTMLADDPDRNVALTASFVLKARHHDD